MDSKWLEDFVALIDSGGFSRAAEACGVTQPALTTAVKRLEKEVGGDLFHREGRRLVLSEVVACGGIAERYPEAVAAITAACFLLLFANGR